VRALTHPYASAAYARAFEGLAQPIELPGLRNWALVRQIPGSQREDVAGCYPLTVLGDLGGAPGDFAILRERGFVSLVLVADALAQVPVAALQSCFDHVRPFKTHYIHDYARPFAYARHHRYEIRRARKSLEIRAAALADHLVQWNEMYDALVARHGIAGLQRFSRTYFVRLAALAGLQALGAWSGDRLVGMHLFFEHEGIVYSHLAAFSAEGYDLRAGYALNDGAIEHFRGRRLIDFGAGAGSGDDPENGLAVFKRGFANHALLVHLCGKVLDKEAYARLSEGRDESTYFPAYRGS
jgi:hypothetical protein